MRTLDELEKVLEETMVEIPLEFMIRTMKVLEIAESTLGLTEQGDLAVKYCNAYYHEIKNYLNDKEIAEIENNNLLDEL